MKGRRLFSGLCPWLLCLAAASPALGLANRVFASARSGNDANSCDNVNTPCKTFSGAVMQLNPDGDVIVLDSGGHGAVTITQGVTIEAPAGVTAFVHPSSGDAITINAGGAAVTLRGLVLNGGSNNGITVNSVGTCPARRIRSDTLLPNFHALSHNAQRRDLCRSDLYSRLPP